MNSNDFDTMTTWLAARRARRTVLRSASVSLATAILGIAALRHAGAQSTIPAATPGASPVAGCPTTTEAANAAIARRWTEDMLNGRDLSVLDEIAAPDIVSDAPGYPTVHGRAAVKQSLQRGIFAAFPDVQDTTDQVVVQHDLVAVRFTGRGTDNGKLHGIPATGSHVTFTGINLYRIACGRIAAVWSEVDAVEQLQRIGALPATPGESTPAS